MSDQEKDNIVAEALGLCVHEWKTTTFPHCKCKSCGEVIIGIEEDGTEHDFSTWEGFGLIRELGPSRNWWPSFLNHLIAIADDESSLMYVADNRFIPIGFVKPIPMRDTLSQWLIERRMEGKP